MVTNKLLNLTFVYPNKDEIQSKGALGDSLYHVATKNGIQMNPKFLKSCMVQIQVREAHSFGTNPLAQPTQEELKELTPFQIDDGFRFAHTYMIDEALDNAVIFLNLVRLVYIDEGGKEYQLSAYTNESMLSLRERSTSVIDLSFACHGALACSTCHCVFDVTDRVFQRLGEISEDEEDLLQFCKPEKHSRLGCQILELRDEFDGLLRVRNPRAKSHV